MRFPLSEQDHSEIIRFQLRSACCDCGFYVDEEARCGHEWPSNTQALWPLAGEVGCEASTEISLCKEFDLR